jgi:hypothetical protein
MILQRVYTSQFKIGETEEIFLDTLEGELECFIDDIIKHSKAH